MRGSSDPEPLFFQLTGTPGARFHCITEDSLYFGAEVLYRAIVQTVQAMASGRDKEELQ